ncbi:MAG: hypothetical protein Q7S97_01850 [Polaromonas sp.]|nr:hypothetical protein [Polaromonas sp.]
MSPAQDDAVAQSRLHGNRGRQRALMNLGRNLERWLGLDAHNGPS